jgi:FkbM family methyltransferase
VKTSLQEKINYVTAGNPVARDLLRIFSPSQALFIVDCGACDGLDSVIYSRLFPAATVYAIEARQDNFAEIQLTLAEFKARNVTPIQACLSDRGEQVQFWSSFGDSGHKKAWDTGNKSSSILRPTGHLPEHGWCRFNQETASTMRFDQLGIPRVDYLHLDVQGAELKVLEGFGEVLNTMTALWVEVARKELYAGQPLAHDVERYLQARGFVKLADTSEGRKYGDQLWRRRTDG